MPKYTPEEEIINFWSRVAITADDDKCWLWLGGQTGYGYGACYLTISNIKKQYPAHNFAWIYPNYVIPNEMRICHSCDNPLCCNPKHLWIGTHQDNMDDMNRKGRGLKGKKRSKRNSLSDSEQENLIKSYREKKISIKELAFSFGLSINYMALLMRLKGKR